VIDEITNGIEVNPKTLSFDMIKEIGQHGAYITHKETAKAYHTIWRTESILYEDGKDEGRKWRDPVGVAREAIRWILENHHPSPIDENVSKELRHIVDKADNDEALKSEVRGGK
jgi:trimethylamine:corrinoid methyltransferase-like protein